MTGPRVTKLNVYDVVGPPGTGVIVTKLNVYDIVERGDGDGTAPRKRAQVHIRYGERR